MNNRKEKLFAVATRPLANLETPSIRVSTAFRQSADRICRDSCPNYAEQWQTLGYDSKKNKLVVRASSLPEPKVVDGLSMAMRDALGYPCTVEFVVNEKKQEADAQPKETFYSINPNVIPGLSDYEALKKIFPKTKAFENMRKQLKLTPFTSDADKSAIDAQQMVDEKFFSEIVDVSCRVFGVTQSELFSPLRTRKTFKARQAIAIFLRGNFNLSFKKIGSMLRRDHSSIIYMTQSEKEIPKFLESESFLNFFSKAKNVMEKYMP